MVDSPASGPDSGPESRWRGHPWLARAVRSGVVVTPLAVGVAAAVLVGAALPHPHTTLATVAWWAIVLAMSTAIVWAIEPLARRLLPLAVLLDLSLLFPDTAPSRFRLALKSGSVKHVHDYLDTDDEARPATADAILTLVAALGSHHRPSRKHSERVRAYTELIAEELRLPAGDRHRLRWAALLHDIGKVDVPIEVLNGTGPLSDAGWKVIHRHPIDGNRLIAPLRDWLGPWADAVVQHHERFDGAGYPHGLRGEEICLGGRIVAVADSFEAMTARRSYQEAMPVDKARARLAELSGTQFDPAVVRAFLAVSITRVRWAYGPLTWLAETPALAAVARLGPAATGAAARAGAAAIGVALAASPAPGVQVAGLTFSRSVQGAVQAAAGPSRATTADTAGSSATRPSSTATSGKRPATAVNGTTTTAAVRRPAGSTPATVTVTLPPQAPVKVTLPTLPPITRPTTPTTARR